MVGAIEFHGRFFALSKGGAAVDPRTRAGKGW